MNASVAIERAPRSLGLFRRHQHLVRSDQQPDSIYHIEEGWAARYTLLGNGRRQITALFLPGDYCEPQWLLDRGGTDPVLALTDVRARAIPIGPQGKAIAPETETRSLVQAMLELVRRQTRWIVSLGRMTATERLCALLNDLFERARIDRANALTCAMPLTQTDLADIVGLTPIHTNRVLRELRARGIVEIRSKQMSVGDPVLLRRIGSGQMALPMLGRIP